MWRIFGIRRWLSLLSVLWLFTLPLVSADNSTQTNNYTGSWLTDWLNSNLVNNYSSMMGADTLWNSTNDAKTQISLFIGDNTGINNPEWIVLFIIFLLIGIFVAGILLAVAFSFSTYLCCIAFNVSPDLIPILVLFMGLVGGILGFWKWGTSAFFKKTRKVIYTLALILIVVLVLALLGFDLFSMAGL